MQRESQVVAFVYSNFKRSESAMKIKLKQNVWEDHLTISRFHTQSTSTSGTRYSSDPIPVDLLLNILSRLSVKSKAKFRCVSKQWSSILRRPYFRILFPTRSIPQPRLLFVVQVEGNLHFLSSHQSQNPLEDMPPVAIDAHRYFPNLCSSQICGHVNGFVCFQDQGKNCTVICNPRTGELLTLPEVKTEFGSRTYFGYDPINEEFKVLCTTWKTFGAHVEHHVMTLGTGTMLLWRTIRCGEPHLPKQDGICINGVLYYQTINKIVCFDVRSEKFSYITNAKSMVTWGNSVLINYKGKLGVLLSKHITSTIKLWVLEDGKEGIWSKHIYKTPPEFWSDGARDTYAVGMTAIGEIVLSPYRMSRYFYVFYYNIEMKTITRVNIRGIKGFQDQMFYTFLDFVEDVKLM